MRIVHTHMDILVTKDLVFDFPNFHFEKHRLYDVCQKGKQVKISFKSKIVNFSGNYHGIVIVDDYSCYICMIFLSLKRDVFRVIWKLSKIIKNEKGLSTASIWYDHIGEFQNKELKN